MCWEGALRRGVDMVWFESMLRGYDARGGEGVWFEGALRGCVDMV